MPASLRTLRGGLTGGERVDVCALPFTPSSMSFASYAFSFVPPGARRHSLLALNTLMCQRVHSASGRCIAVQWHAPVLRRSVVTCPAAASHRALRARRAVVRTAPRVVTAKASFNSDDIMAKV